MRLPLMMEMRDQPVTCIGAGPVAAGKVVPMLECGAEVTVIAPSIDAGLHRAHTCHQRSYRPGDLDGDPRPRLVVAGTGVREVDDAVAAEAAALGIWCLRIDGEGDVSLPSVIRRGALVVALATGAPALTRRLRQSLGATLDGRWEEASTTLAGLRGDPVVRTALSAVPAAVRRRRWRDAVDLLLADIDADGRAAAAILVGDPDPASADPAIADPATADPAIAGHTAEDHTA